MITQAEVNAIAAKVAPNVGKIGRSIKYPNFRFVINGFTIDQTIKFRNPRDGVEGWSTREEVVYDAGRFIKNGHMKKRLNADNLG